MNYKLLNKLYLSYKSYKPSDRCYLNGKFFNKVFAEYEGLVYDPIALQIDQDGNLLPSKSVGNVVGSVIESPSRFNHNLEHADLIRIKIVINNGGDDNNTQRHSNCVIVDHAHKEIYRFEPMISHNYETIINNTLRDYFDSVGFHDYEYMELNIHPQVYDELCPDKGMCVAYVIKFATLYILNQDFETILALGSSNNGRQRNSERESDIKQFSSAIEKLYVLD